MKPALKRRPKVLVVVHDAGGAEVIGAYIRARRADARFLAYGAGPAAAVFKRLKLPLRHVGASERSLVGVMRQHADAAHALIAAPGWMTTTEINATKAAKKTGLKTVIYIDSWEDERKRFGFPKAGWKKHLPDEFIVGDRYAYVQIRAQYPHIPVRLVPNQYFADELNRYRALKRAAPSPNAVLFVSQDRPHSHELLEELLHVLGKLKKRTRLRIRFHPVDGRARYDVLLKSVRGTVDVTKSREKDLVKDLLHAKLVIGTETGAMAIAVLCGIRTVSLLPKYARPMLPYPQIKRIHTVKQVARLVR